MGMSMLMDDGLYGDAVKDYWCVFLNIFMLILGKELRD